MPYTLAGALRPGWRTIAFRWTENWVCAPGTRWPSAQTGCVCARARWREPATAMYVYKRVCIWTLTGVRPRGLVLPYLVCWPESRARWREPATAMYVYKCVCVWTSAGVGPRGLVVPYLVCWQEPCVIPCSLGDTQSLSDGRKAGFAHQDCNTRRTDRMRLY
jgi:hypothetical protein